MILLWAFVVSFLVALVRGGRVTDLARVGLKHGWLALVAFGLQIVNIYFPLETTEGLWGPRTLLLIASYGLLVGMVLLNRGLPGMPLIGVGLALNLAVMLANGGFMPVTYEALERANLDHLALGSEPGARIMATKDIVLPREDTRLWLLSDIFVVGPPSPLRTIFSLGDLAVAAGVFWLFQRVMGPRAKKAAHATLDGC